MRIEKIEIANFKGFSNETFVLNPQFTVFIGDNGKGKTSILDALAVAVGSFLRGIDVAKSEARVIKKNEVRVKTIDDDPRPQLPVSIKAYGSVSGKEVEGGWYRNVDEITRKTTTKYIGARNIERIAASMLKQNRAEGKVTFPTIAYHGTGRLWAEHEEKKIQYRKQDEGVARAYSNCLSPKSTSKQFLSWYKTFEDEIRKFNQDSDKLLLEVFNECITSMIPDDQWHDMAFSFKDDDLIGIFVTPEGKNERLLFKQLSDGFRSIIGMVADIAYSCIMLNPHLGKDVLKETPGIVLVDEIDLHLHPNWQKRIVADLKRTFPKMQFVATTHSPFIVQSLKSDELVILDDMSLKDTDPFRKSIEDISATEMGVEDVTRSSLFREMQKIAEEYYALVLEGKNSKDDKDLLILRNRLNELEDRFGDDPAFVAALKMERNTK